MNLSANPADVLKQIKLNWNLWKQRIDSFNKLSES
jgi:hypothetical protein